MTPRGSGLAEVATVTQRLAVLLAAGVEPASAWRHVAASSPSPVPAAVASAADKAATLAAIAQQIAPLERSAWRGLAAAWLVATEAGAPLAPSLRNYAESLRQLAQAQRDARVALAAPIATARMVVALPVVGVLFGMALGFNTLQTLFLTPAGWGCLVVGVGLILLALRWNRRLVRAASPTEATPGLACDLMAIAMSGGAALDRARALVDHAVNRFEVTLDDERLRDVLELSRSAGVPAGADEHRRDARAAAQERASTLSVRLMLPLGLCILPAFMVLGVLPLLVTVVSSTVGTF
jgi:tight adherence protein B